MGLPRPRHGSPGTCHGADLGEDVPRPQQVDDGPCRTEHQHHPASHLPIEDLLGSTPFAPACRALGTGRQLSVLDGDHIVRKLQQAAVMGHKHRCGLLFIGDVTQQLGDVARE